MYLGGGGGREREREREGSVVSIIPTAAEQERWVRKKSEIEWGQGGSIIEMSTVLQSRFQTLLARRYVP